MSITAKLGPINFSARIEDRSRIDPEDYGAIGDGKSHPLSERYRSLEEAKKIYPHAQALDEEIDWAAIQQACDVAMWRVRNTVVPEGNSIGRTGVSYSSPIWIPPGHFIVNRPVVRYPHVSIQGTGWNSCIRLADKGWARTAPRLTANPKGVMWAGQIHETSALLWFQGDEEWPLSSGLRVAGMEDSISHLKLVCHDGPCIFNAENQNAIQIHHNLLKGYGDGPTGLGIVSNNATSSTQITNLFCHDNMIEGCRAAMVFDKLEPGSIRDNQIESCANGIYVAHHSRGKIKDNILTNFIPNRPFENGIWVGTGLCSISGNEIIDVEKIGIKTLGQTKIFNNNITIKNGAKINESGYAIRIVGPSKQFGGDTSVLGGKHSHHVHGNHIDADVWPVAKPLPGFPNPAPLKAIYIDSVPGEKIKARVENNVEGPL